MSWVKLPSSPGSTTSPFTVRLRTPETSSDTVPTTVMSDVCPVGTLRLFNNQDGTGRVDFVTVSLSVTLLYPQ